MQYGQLSGSTMTLSFPVSHSSVDDFSFIVFAYSTSVSNTLHSTAADKTVSGVSVGIGQYNYTGTTRSGYTHQWLTIGT